VHVDNNVTDWTLILLVLLAPLSMALYALGRLGERTGRNP
jgi:hypothetical protein